MMAIEHIEPPREPKSNIWDEPYFLERLQDFIMAEPA